MDKKRRYQIIACNKCGKQMHVRSDYVNKHSGTCLSCQRATTKYSLKHGDSTQRLYRIWSGLSHRRYKTHNPIVCNAWKSYIEFKNWAFSNGYSESLTIDRIDNTGNYEPNNCRWISLEENSAKDKRIFSEKQCLDVYTERKQIGVTQKEMAQKLGVSRNTIQRAEKKAREVI